MSLNALNASSLWLLRQLILILPSVGRCEYYYKTMGALEHCSELERNCLPKWRTKFTTNSESAQYIWRTH